MYYLMTPFSHIPVKTTLTRVTNTLMTKTPSMALAGLISFSILYEVFFEFFVRLRDLVVFTVCVCICKIRFFFVTTDNKYDIVR